MGTSIHRFATYKTLPGPLRLWRSPLRWILLPGVATLIVAACSGGGGSDDIFMSMEHMSEGDVVGDFELVLFGNANHSKGETMKLSESLSRPVVVNFWFPSCPPCRAEIPDLERSFQAHRDAGVQFIGVQLLGLDSADDGQDFIDRIGVSYAVGPDGDSNITKEYDITSFPTTFFLDRGHKIVRKHTGILTSGQIERFVQEILASPQPEAS